MRPKTDSPPLRVAWISGWTIPTSLLREQVESLWSNAQHEVYEPGAHVVAEVLASEADVLAGFSLGAHLLLTIDDARPRILLAPFVDLKKEAGLGGAVATIQLRQQRRWLQRDPAAAIADFRTRIGSTTLPYENFGNLEALIWGLEHMLAPAKISLPLPAGSLAVAGENDPLLDIPTLRKALPSLHTIACGHQLQPLLAAALNLRQNGET